jgi:hypothetical protein
MPLKKPSVSFLSFSFIDPQRTPSKNFDKFFSSLSRHNFPENAFPSTACVNASVRFVAAATSRSIASARQIGAIHSGRTRAARQGYEGDCVFLTLFVIFFE